MRLVVKDPEEDDECITDMNREIANERLYQEYLPRIVETPTSDKHKLVE